MLLTTSRNFCSVYVIYSSLAPSDQQESQTTIPLLKAYVRDPTTEAPVTSVTVGDPIQIYVYFDDNRSKFLFYWYHAFQNRIHP